MYWGEQFTGVKNAATSLEDKYILGHLHLRVRFRPIGFALIPWTLIMGSITPEVSNDKAEGLQALQR